MYNGHLSIEELEQLNQQKGPAENQSHVENCRQCRELLEDCQAISAKLAKLASVPIGAANGMNCPDPRVWLDVAAGTLPDEETARHVQHAADCPSCGPRLRTATRLFAEELTPEEEKAIRSLPSASPTAQRELAEKLSESTVAAVLEPVQKRKRSFWWPLSFSLAGAAAVAAVAFFTVPLLISRNSPADVQSLLAEAYTQNRQIEMRIPGAKHAEMKQQRSGEAGSLLAMPEAERKALDKIASGQKKDPDNPQWLILQAQADLLDRRYKPALNALNRVEVGTDTTDFLLTRALALNEQGQAEHDPQLQGHAVDLLGRILQKEPDNTTALFNQAIVCEELYIYECASKNWQHLLEVEKDPGWIDEARQHLTRIQGKKTSRALGLQPLLDPQRAWAELKNAHPLNALQSEAYLNLVFTKWLRASWLQPTGGTDGLIHLAYALKENQADFWLSDFLKARFSSKGTDLLFSAINANYSGDHQTALHDADLAARKFREAKNMAGALLSQYQAVYALRRQSHSKQCLDLITRIEPLLDIHHYRWLQLQVAMEHSVCEGYIGHFDEAAQLANVAVIDAERANYPSLALRTLSLLASWHTAEGRFRQSWTKNEEGLGRFWNADFPSERGFQLYSDLELTAEQTEEWHLAFVLQKEVLALINETGRLDFQATAHLHLATTAAAIRDSRETQQEFSNAHDLFATLPQTATIQFLEADSKIGLVQQQIDHGQIQSAHNQLTEIGQAISAATSFVVRLKYQKTWAALDRQISNTAQEKMALQEVVKIGNEGYRSLKTGKDRWEWAHEVGDSYRRLLELEVEQSHSPEHALADWELYKIRQSGASTRMSNTTTGNLIAEKDLIALAQGLRRSTLLTFAVFPEWTIIWTFDNRGTHETRIQIAANELKKLIQNFYFLCSDPESSLQKVNREGLRLYKLLIGPISSHIDGKRSLLIEPDTLLAPLPWAALVTEDGTYLGERYKLLQTPGLFYLQPRTVKFTRAARILLASPGAIEVEGHIYSSLPKSEEEAESIRKQYLRMIYLRENEVTTENLRRFLPSVSIFHFAGHAVSDAYGGELVIHGKTDGELFSSSTLDSLDLNKVRLVVLSACSTAFAEGEIARDPNGLVQAFLRSGAKQVLASRWDINSESTALLMENFHAYLVTGVDPADALDRSRSILINIPSNSHPYYWASFELLGTEIE